MAQGKAIHSDEELARLRGDLEALRTESKAALTQQQQRPQALETELNAATKALEAARQERDTAYASHSHSIRSPHAYLPFPLSPPSLPLPFAFFYAKVILGLGLQA